MSHSRHILIFGGTSGMGLALAQAHADLGWQISVVGSSADKAAALKARLPEWSVYCADLRDEVQRNDLLAKLDNFAPFERVVYAAGHYLNERRFDLSADESAAMLAVNLQAFQAAFAWAAPRVAGEDAALVCLSSVAALVDYPYTSLYAQCKRAMWHTAAAYRTALAPRNVAVLAVASGYVDTAKLREINGGSAAHKPFIVSEERAVREIMAALNARRDVAIFPKRMRVLCALLNCLPAAWVGYIMRRKLDGKVLPRK